MAGILQHNGLMPEGVAADETFLTGRPEGIAARMLEYRRVGLHSFTVESPAPYDAETLETLMHEVRPMVEAGGTGS